MQDIIQSTSYTSICAVIGGSRSAYTNAAKDLGAASSLTNMHDLACR